MEKKSFQEKLKKINIIDLIAVIIIALVAVVVLWKVVDNFLPEEPAPSTSEPAPGATSSPTETTPPASGTTTPAIGTAPSAPTKPADPTPKEEQVRVTYTVRADNQPAALYDAVSERIPSRLMADGVLYDDCIVAVEKEPVKILDAGGHWVEDPERVNLLFTVEGTVASGKVMTTRVATQEVRIGDPGYDLKTECLEFRDTTVVDVTWKDWDLSKNNWTTSAEEMTKQGYVPFTYTVRAEDRPAELYGNVLPYLNTPLMASGGRHAGWVINVEAEPVMVLADNGEWVENPDRVNLVFTVGAYAPQKNVQVVKVGTQEIRLGLPNYILKTEYLEFRNTVVVDMEWTEWSYAHGAIS